MKPAALARDAAGFFLGACMMAGLLAGLAHTYGYRAAAWVLDRGKR